MKNVNIKKSNIIDYSFIKSSNNKQDPSYYYKLTTDKRKELIQEKYKQ